MAGSRPAATAAISSTRCPNAPSSAARPSTSPGGSPVGSRTGLYPSGVRPRRRLALAQVAPKLGDVGANLDLHRELAERAADDGADMCIFPELGLTGYF